LHLCTRSHIARTLAGKPKYKKSLVAVAAAATTHSLQTAEEWTSVPAR